MPAALRARAESFVAASRETGAEGVSGLIAEAQALADVVAGTVVSWDRLFVDD
ncbi:hypothetical protein ACUXJ6_001887 [Kocuria palustris]|uniref:hypothetical protein n=1 Tax=Kocuria soli TaxID=2485125 RepID=UPI0013151382|nr:hypothetical protein [Kocuria soli]